MTTHGSDLPLLQASTDAQRPEARRKLQALDSQEAIRELEDSLLNRRSLPRASSHLMATLAEIGKVLGVTFRAPQQFAEDAPWEDVVAAIAHASHVRARNVKLRSEWWRTDAGPLLGSLVEGRQPVALLFRSGRYELLNLASGTRRRIDRQIDSQLARDAIAFIRPLPTNDASSMTQLLSFVIRPITGELLIVVFLALAVALLGMLVPISTGLVIDAAIPDADLSLLYQLAAGLLTMALAQTALSFSQSTLLLRCDTVITSCLQAAVFDRLLRLPARFFRRYSSGDLQNRAMMITEISKEISYTAVGGILTGSLAGLNLFLCFYYNANLALVAVVSAAVLAAYTGGLSVLIRRLARDQVIGQGKLFGFQVQLITGISKLHLAGAEVRAFNQWARRMADQVRLVSGIQRLEQWGGLVNTALQQSSTICLYYLAVSTLVRNGVGQSPGNSGPALLTLGTFLAFYVTFQKLIEGMTSLSNTVVNLTDSWTKRCLVAPLLEARPEDPAERVDPGPLSGGIVVSQLWFRYRADGPWVLNDIGLRAEPGEFIAIVGPSGCGKSTLLRLLLGFEIPDEGTIAFDGRDLRELDVLAVRRQIGAVLQSGTINSGSVFENLAGASRITVDEAWIAARAAGLDMDLAQMPMGMHSFVNEGGTTLSGGQRQRLLIARALVRKPKILLFDEATSALDNRTQRIVTESLDRMQVTRIVVAHRLSTIRHAHRIYVMQQGRIVQSGTFDELSTQDGQFRRLMSRQLLPAPHL